MSGTVAAAVKAKLLGTNNILAALLPGVIVAYDMTRDVPREIVHGGAPVTGPVTLSAQRAGTRIKREENLNTQIHIRVYEPGNQTTEATDARAATISAIVENYIAANPTLGDLTNVKLVAVEGLTLTGWLNDDGATSELSLALAIKSYLD